MNEELETWRNTCDSTFYVKVSGANGAMELVPQTGGKTFHITPADRQRNVMEAVSSAFDPFSNGTFTPMKLVETASDYEELRANPAQITDTEMKTLFAGPFAALEARIAELTNPVTLRRLVAIGEEPANAVSAAKLAAVVTRLRAVDGRPPGSVQKSAGATAGRSAGAPPPEEASFYDMGPASASIT